MSKLGIEYVWAPVYSPELNAIEFYFSMLKRKVKQARLAKMVLGEKVTYEELVSRAVEEIEKDKIENCESHVLKTFNLK